MATDTERREVARRLNRVADKYDGVACTIVEGHLGIEFDERFVGGSVYTSESVKRLADLIDPDTTTDTTKSPELTTKCDRDALLELVDEIDSMERVTSHNEVRVSDEVLVSITRRIREALGGGR